MKKTQLEASILIKMIWYSFLSLFTVFFNNSLVYSYTLDYVKANKNAKVYDQVPKNELIFAKIQASEPWYFPEIPLRGKGYFEPIVNEFINAIRKSKISTYVDYFTSAKVLFYRTNSGYEMCFDGARTLSQYQTMINNAKKNNYQHEKKIQLYTIPIMFDPAVGLIGIGSKKRSMFQKHLWPGTNVYNTKSILDDSDLYTVEMTGFGSSIREYIIINPDLSSNLIRPEYKKRVYDFVASNAFQIPLMLKGNRMDWVDLSFLNDFYIKKFKIGPESILLAPLSNNHPNSLKMEDIKVTFFRCIGTDRKKLEKIINIINSIALKLRTNIDFWTDVMKQYAKDMDFPYQAPKDAWETKTMVQWKEQIDKGMFDFN